MWASCIRWVSSLGTLMVIPEIPFIFPPDFPVNKMVDNPLYCACLIAACTFSELPLVEIPINTSPLLPMPCTCLEKIDSKSVSFDQAVMNELSVVKAIDGIGLRSWLIIPPISSVAKCCASAALPPFPHQSIFPPFRIESIISDAAELISSVQHSTMAFLTNILSEICFFIFSIIMILHV